MKRLMKTLGWVCLGSWLFAGWAMASWAQSVVTTPQVRAELVAHAPQGLVTGQPMWLGLRLQHQPGWHTYWKNAGDSGLATQLEWSLPPGVQAGTTTWPLPNKLTVGDLTNYGFEGQVLLGAALTLPTGFNPPGGLLDVQLKAHWLVCRQECIPQEGVFRLQVPLHSSQVSHAREFDALQRDQAQSLAVQGSVAEVEPQRLRLRIDSLPVSVQGQTLQLFPELNEVIESAAERHPLAKQSWQGAVWTAELPLSALRSTEPTRLPLVLVASAGAQRQGFRVVLPVNGRWPELSALPTPSATGLAVGNGASDKTSAATPAPIDSSGADLSWWGALLGAFLGGLVLNLMPCVLPVLALKTLHLARPDTPARVRHLEGGGYAAGVMASMLALGSTLMALKAGGEQLGWGFQLQSPLVVCLLALLFTLIALNLWGLFSIQRLLPSSITEWSSPYPGREAFLTGVLAVAVATPCTAPFMGASLGLALTLPSWQGLGIFVALGFGLALPMLLVIVLPGLSAWLPRPGPWMETLRQALGFPMLATVVWLLWVLGHQVGVDGAVLLLGLLVLLSSFLWSLRFPGALGRLISGLLLVVLFAATGWGQSSLLQAPPTPSTISSATWQPWSNAKVEQALRDGRPVFVDFTAAWCITCQINKRTTLSHASVLKAFDQQQVVLLQADWTRQDPAITAALSQLGRSGVPVYVLHRPGQAPLLLSELLSPGVVLDALATLNTLTPVR